jgi:hypothetical protein
MEKEIPKQLVVIVAYTVTDPGTVVVHPHHTSIANTAVVGARRSE